MRVVNCRFWHHFEHFIEGGIKKFLESGVVRRSYKHGVSQEHLRTDLVQLAVELLVGDHIVAVG